MEIHVALQGLCLLRSGTPYITVYRLLSLAIVLNNVFVDLMGVPCRRENRLIKVGDQPFDLVNRRWGKGGRDSERRDFSVHLFQSFNQSSTRTEIFARFLHFHFFNLSACKLFWTYFELFLSLPPPLLRPFDFQLGKLKQYIG